MTSTAPGGPSAHDDGAVDCGEALSRLVEFLDPIPPGLPPAEFLARLEAAVEGASDRLMAEAGFVRPRSRISGSRPE